MLIALILAGLSLALAPHITSAQINPSPCGVVSVSPNPARAGQSLVMHAECRGCDGLELPTTTIERDGSTIHVTSRVPRSCLDIGPGLPWEFESDIGAYLPGEYTLVHVFQERENPYDPVTTGFVVQAQVVPASGAAARVLGVLAVLTFGMGMLWRHRVGEARGGRSS